MMNKAYGVDQTVREIHGWFTEDLTSAELDETAAAISDAAAQHHFEGLIPIEEFLAEVLSGDDPAFEISERLIAIHDLKFVKPQLFRRPLARYFSSIIELFENYSPEYEYSPSIVLFFECCFKLDLGAEWFTKPLAYTSKSGVRAFELFNNLLDLIRYELRNAEFNGEINCR